MKKILALTLMIVALCGVTNLWAAQERPDILFIAIDDLNDWTTVFDKNNPIQTPNLERLAARGAFFEKAYCASASCNPSRTATLTGLRPSTSGVYNNPVPWAEMLPDVITLPQAFKHNGYAAIGAGKIFTHGKAGAEQKDNPSFDAFYKLQPAGKSKLHAEKSHMNYNGYPGRKRFFDWGEHDTDKQADEHTVEYVNEVMASHPREKPLFLAAGIYRPHMPFLPRRGPLKSIPSTRFVCRRCQRMISRTCPRSALRWQASRCPSGITHRRNRMIIPAA